MLRGFLIAAAIPVVLWSGYWGAGAWALKQGAHGVLKEGQNGELSGQFAQAQVGGYPSAFNLTLTDLHVRDAGLFAWSVPSARVNAPSYRPQSISVDLEGPQEIRTTLGAMMLEAEALQIETFIRPSLDVPLGRALLQVDEAFLSHEAGWSVRLDDLDVNLRDTPQADAPAMGIYQLEAAATEIDLSDLLPELPQTHQQVPEFSTAMQLSFSKPLDRHAFAGSPPTLSGLVIEQAEIRLGESEATLSGQFQIAEDGQLSGTVTLGVTNWQGLMAALRESGYINPDVADLVTDALLEQGMTDRLTLPLRVEDGVVQFGMFRLGVLPRLP